MILNVFLFYVKKSLLNKQGDHVKKSLLNKQTGFVKKFKIYVIEELVQDSLQETSSC